MILSKHSFFQECLPAWELTDLRVCLTPGIEQLSSLVEWRRLPGKFCLVLFGTRADSLRCQEPKNV